MIVDRLYLTELKPITLFHNNLVIDIDPIYEGYSWFLIFIKNIKVCYNMLLGMTLVYSGKLKITDEIISKSLYIIGAGWIINIFESSYFLFLPASTSWMCLSEEKIIIDITNGFAHCIYIMDFSKMCQMDKCFRAFNDIYWTQNFFIN